MRKIAFLIPALLLACVPPGVDSEASFDEVVDPLEVQVGLRYIVRYHEDAWAADPGLSGLDSLTRRQAGLQIEENSVRARGGVVARSLAMHNAMAAYLTPEALDTLQNDSRVALIERDLRRYPMAQTVPYGIAMVQADQLGDENTGALTICIIDSGINANHEDLRDNNMTGSNTEAGPWGQDGCGHGTHVAGTVAAVNNTEGVVGVLPNRNVNLHIVRVFDDSCAYAYSSDVAGAAQLCAQNGADIISMSLGGSGSSSTEGNVFQDLLNNGILSIAAAGNSGNSSYSYPASYDAVVSVAAVNSSEVKANFSQFNDQVELTAPGVSVNSTYLPGDDTYAQLNGTSMATPHVSAVAALVWSHQRQCTAAQIRNALAISAKDLGNSGRDNDYGYGLVQAQDAVDYIDANGCPNEIPDTGAPATELTDEVPVTGLSGSQGSLLNFTIEVPAGQDTLTISIAGGSGDADLYVRFGDAPTTSTYDCRPYLSGNNETCTVNNPAAGTWYVMLRAYSSFSGVSVVADYQGPGGGGGGLGDGVAVSDLSDSTGGEQDFFIEVPAGQESLTVQISGGTGDADVYVRFGAPPSLQTYDCRPYRSGNNETCTFDNPQAGTWHIMVRAYRTYSGVTLVADYEGGQSGNVLAPGVPVTGLSGAQGDEAVYTINVPAGRSVLDFLMSAGTGDGDLYVRYGDAPTTSTYDCRSWVVGNNETCTMNSPQAGTWYVMVRAYRAYSGASLVASY